MKKHLLFSVVTLFMTCSIINNTIAQSVYIDQVSSNFAGVYGSYSLTDGTGSAARFDETYGICVDPSGNIFVADYLNHAIRKVTPAGVVTTIAGNGTSGYVDATGSAARFNKPIDICIDGSGNLYVTEEYNNCIRKVTQAGVVTTFAGSATCGYLDATGGSAKFCQPTGICIDGSGNLFIGDRNNDCIRKITSAGVVTTFAGNGTAGSGYVNATGTAARFDTPQKICIDGSGNLYVIDDWNNRIRKITSAGVVTTLAGNGVNANVDGPAASASFDYMYSIAVDAIGNVYVGGSAKIKKITTDGFVINYCGNGVGGDTNGPLSVTQMISVEGMAFNSSGDMYVSSFYLRKISAQTNLTGFTTTAGTASSYQSFSVSGTSLTGNLTVTAPTDFEVSLSSASGYASSVSIIPSSNVVTSTTIYIRIKSSAAAGSPSGSIAVSAAGASDATLTVSGTVNAITIPPAPPATTAIEPSLSNNVDYIYYPNPTSGILNISFKNNNRINSLQLFSATGTKILDVEVNNSDYILNMDSMLKGIYYLHIQTENGEKTEKIVKQ